MSKFKCKVKVLAALLGGVALLSCTAPGASAIDIKDKDAFLLARENINELLDRYDHRATLATMRSGCAAYSQWNDFSGNNAKYTKADNVDDIFTPDDRNDLWYQLPEEVREKAWFEDNLHDALEFLKTTDLYRENARFKAIIDTKLAEVNAFLANINQVKAEANRLKQDLTKYFPDYKAEISELTYDTVIGSGGLGGNAETCSYIETLRVYTEFDQDELGSAGTTTSAGFFTRYYPRVAQAMLHYDSTVLDGIKLPLHDDAQRAWDLVHEARELPNYDAFQAYFDNYSVESLVKLVKIFYPELVVDDYDEDGMHCVDDKLCYSDGIVALVKALYPDLNVDEYARENQELLSLIWQKIPLYDQYDKLYTYVKYVESKTNGMKETGGAAMLYDDAYGQEELLNNMSEAIAEIEKATEPIEVLPTAPNTGSEGEELAGTIATFALTGTVGIAAVTGAVIVAKRYAYSPLKRRK